MQVSRLQAATKPSLCHGDLDLSALAPGVDLRDTIELDSLDFVELVDRLSTRAGLRIEEDDADGMCSLDAAINFLVARTSP